MFLHPFSRQGECRRGGVTPLAILSLALLVGVLALVIDGGGLLEERRHVQAGADAAALAAAADLFSNYSTCKGLDTPGTAQASALATAQANGFGNDGVQSVVTVNVSPQNYQGGPNAGTALPPGYAEVIIQYNVSRTFSNLFGSGTVPVRARAVARGQWMPISNKVVSLNGTAPSAVSVSGSASLNINGGLLVNSSNSSAVSVAPQATLSATSVNLNSGGGGLVGSLLSGLLGLLGLGGGGGSSSPPITYSPPTPDPLRSLPAPDPVQLTLPLQGTNLNIAGGTQQLYPGVYQGGITISQGASVTLHANSDGTPGIYFLQGGGLTTSGTSSLTMVAGETAGVMIYNDWQQSTDMINLAGTGSLVLAPPGSGTYQGVTLFQKRGTASNPAPELTILGSGNVNVTGTIYAAYGDVTLTGVSGTNVMGGQIVADTVTTSGRGTVNVNPGSNPVARTRLFNLVE